MIERYVTGTVQSVPEKIFSVRYPVPELRVLVLVFKIACCVFFNIFESKPLTPNFDIHYKKSPLKVLFVTRVTSYISLLEPILAVMITIK